MNIISSTLLLIGAALLAACEPGPGTCQAQVWHGPGQGQAQVWHGCGTGLAPVLETGVAAVRDVEVVYTAEAVTEAVRQSTVAAQVSGRVMEIRVDVGDRVRKGEVV